ncbi:hypothetical protein [Photorhabdus khanii]|uniref:hypothetical protein n=1 Tax=Photorhabdus khanii TaxID=1004150 RepID=UPI003BB6722A
MNLQFPYSSAKRIVLIVPARTIRGFTVGEPVLRIPAVTPDLWPEAVPVCGFFYQTAIIIIAITDIPLLYDAPGFLALADLRQGTVGVNRQVLAQVAVGIWRGTG